MAAGILAVPGIMPARDRNGRAVIARIRVYQDNTTIPQAVYAEEALETALSQPVTSDDAGRFPLLWIDEADCPVTLGWETDDGQARAFEGLSCSVSAEAALVDDANAALEAIQAFAVLSGSGAPTEGLGVDGNYYIDLENSAIHGPKTAGVWGAGLSLKGATGATGATGPAGPANSLTVGTVTTGLAGSEATVEIAGSAPEQTLSLTIPRGDTGATGPIGATGPAAWQAVTAWQTGTAYSASDPKSVTTHGGETFVCAVSHTSDVFASDLGAGRWVRLAAKGADGLGAGDLIAANNLSDLADAPTARGNLGLGSLALQAASAVAITGGSIAGITDLSVADGGTGASSPSAARNNLGLAIGSDVQAHNANLAALAGLSSAADRVAYFTGAGAAALADFTAAGRALVDDADAAAQRATLGLGNVDNVAVTGKQAIPIMAAGMTAATTAGSAPGTTETTTNKIMQRTLDFDAAATESAQFALPMPKCWNEGTVSFRAIWTHGSTSSNFGVAWGLAGVALSDDDAGDAAFGTEGIVTDTGGTTGDIYITAESGAVTIAGSPAEGDIVFFRVRRKHDDAGDTMAVDARLIGIVLFITTDAGNDA